MSSKFVRSSKFRHVFGTPAKKENTYDGVKVSRSAWDSNKVKANPLFLGVCWEAAGGGSLAILNLDSTGKLKADQPLVSGHKGPVLDFDFNPFNDHIVASVSEDTTVKVWGIPEGGLTSTLTNPLVSLETHNRKVGTADFHPTASNILATSGTEPALKLWDIEKGSELYSINNFAADIIQSVSWNTDGSLMATSSKDKRLRVLDPRTEKVAHDWEAHQGPKGFRALYLSKPAERIFSVGFSKQSERQYSLWDIKNTAEPLATANVDTAAGLLMPFYDNDTGVLFLAGKGDGNIRYYEVTDEGQFIYYLTEYKSNTAQNGCGFLPKRGVDVASCEIARLFKATSNGIVEPISFTVPRKSGQFQEDLYPETAAPIPTLTAEEYKSGKNAPPKTMSLAPGADRTTAAASFTPSGGSSSPKSGGSEVDKLKARVAELEAELKKKEARIKELEGH
jgi:coronin-1B/1C/6